MNASTREQLWNLGLDTIRSLEVERGILASGKEELYGCVFGRDSLITGLLLLSVYERTHDTYYLALMRKILISLARLQGREVNIESGEEPGKIIHEFRPDNHEHLTKEAMHPWYLYPDGIMRNYDSVDATPLFLLALDRYLTLSRDESLSRLLRANRLEALDWLITYGLTRSDGFLAYEYRSERTGGGLRVQSWMDSTESLFFEDSNDTPAYSIAPVEVQAYAHAALLVWAARLRSSDPGRSAALKKSAEKLKQCFNEQFIEVRDSELHIAYAIDGVGKQLWSPRSSMGHVLFAVAPFWFGFEGILEERYVKPLAARLMQDDLFVPDAGIRTLASSSRHYAPNNYHNGSIWPHDTMLIALGLERYGFRDEAHRMRHALLTALEHFQTPLELFVCNDGYQEYVSPTGQRACRTQAWSAAALLAALSAEGF
jgi:glycogen debranching enzyme